MSRVAFARAVSLLLIPASGFAAGRSPADTITPAMRADDPRLAKRVTISEPRIYVGRLLQKLGAQTGVDLSADERDGAADTVVTAYLRDVPLADALEDLWSLLSHKGAAYDWRRERRGEVIAYLLAKPLAAQGLSETLRREVQRAFEAEAAAKQAALRLTRAEMERLAKFDESIAGLLESERQQGGLRAFFEAVPEQTRTALLQGEGRYRVPVASLPPQLRSFITKEWRESNSFKILPDGTRQPVPEPSWIEFFVEAEPAPSLFINMEELGAYSYLGGLPLKRALRTRLHDL
jgi:hypothetical protein